MHYREITVSVDFGGQRSNNLVAAYSDMDVTRPPVGAIIAWAKSMSGISTNLPAGWVECNGQTLGDINSPLNGQVIPNLNGANSQTQRFLRGSTNAGTFGGGDYNTPSVAGCASSGGGYDFAGYANDANDRLIMNSMSIVPSFYEVVWIIRIK